MAQQQINPDPTQFDLDQMYRDEDAGMLPPDAKAHLDAWRAAGTLPKRTPKIPEPPLPNMDQSKGAVGRFITDPNQSLPTIGGIAGGAAAGAVTGGNPFAIRAGSGAGAAAGTYAAKGIEQKTFLPKVSPWELGGQFALGAIMPTGRGAGALASGRAVLPKNDITAIGTKTRDLLGDKAMVPDLVDSPGWDFMRNVSSEGFFSKKPMLNREIENSKTLRDRVIKEAHDALPANIPAPPTSPFNMERGAAGQVQKDALLSNFTKEQQGASRLYDPFMQQYGGVTSKIDIGRGPETISFEQLHQMRSKALADGRYARANNDGQGYIKAVKLQNDINDAMEQMIGSQGKSQYDAISSNYRSIMDTHENDFVSWLREGDATPAEKFLTIFEHPDRLKTFSPEGNITLKSGPRAGQVIPKGKTISQEDAVHLFRNAVGEDSFAQFRADSLFHFAQDNARRMNSGVEILDGNSAMAALQRMPEGVQRALYGKGATDNINKTAEVTAHIQRAREGSGGLWIVMRQPSAVLAGAGAVAATATGGGLKGLALTSAGTIVMLPQIFSKIMLNPKSVELFTRTVAATAPNIKQQLLNQLTAQLVRTGAFAAAEHVVNDKGEQKPVQPVQSSSLNPTGLSIPAPPPVRRSGPPAPVYPQ